MKNVESLPIIDVTDDNECARRSHRAAEHAVAAHQLSKDAQLRVRDAEDSLVRIARRVKQIKRRIEDGQLEAKKLSANTKTALRGA